MYLFMMIKNYTFIEFPNGVGRDFLDNVNKLSRVSPEIMDVFEGVIPDERKRFFIKTEYTLFDESSLFPFMYERDIGSLIVYAAIEEDTEERIHQPGIVVSLFETDENFIGTLILSFPDSTHKKIKLIEPKNFYTNEAYFIVGMMEKRDELIEGEDLKEDFYSRIRFLSEKDSNLKIEKKSFLEHPLPYSFLFKIVDESGKFMFKKRYFYEMFLELNLDYFMVASEKGLFSELTKEVSDYAVEIEGEKELNYNFYTKSKPI